MFGLNKIGLDAIFALSITAVPVLAQDNDVFDESRVSSADRVAGEFRERS